MFFHSKSLLIVGLIIFLAFAYSCGKKKNELKAPAAAPPTVVDVIVARPQAIADTIEANGTVVANEYAELHPEVSGRIIFLEVPEGKFISKGTVIARINDADLEAQVDKSKVLLDLAQKTADRYAKLLAVNGINQSDYDAALNTVAGYKADIVYTQALIDKTIIKAPFDGVAGLRLVSPGAYVSPTDVIASIQSIDKLKIDFTIPQEYANIVQKGGTVDVEWGDGVTVSIAKAEIVAVEPQVNQSTRNIKVRAVLNRGSLNPGTFVKVYIIESQRGFGIMVPTNAIIPEDINNQLVLVKNGKAAIVNVQTGIRQANSVEITKGINAGDTVVVTGVLFARPKTLVKVRKVLSLDKTGK
jgi:membrane fusion protein (multidrug efflux system)